MIIITGVLLIESNRIELNFSLFEHIILGNENRQSIHIHIYYTSSTPVISSIDQSGRQNG
ncbi:hypothetical protein DERF_012241 [Dermatophagoides farinae]|uniref:Galectin domain-containing protein n=1 Tax=Dermatophagoides farinae TaxID=6954 RepID=A0A922KX14_DERFA|nr:hypothetical protein DERF_012241 [Dermatophagoides farinae]